MILIGLGGNLPSDCGGPAATLTAVLARLDQSGVTVLARSRWYESAPVPLADQPWYVNGVASVATSLNPDDLLRCLHGLEAAFGRERGAVNAARTLDLDLLDYNGIIRKDWPVLPHPRLHERRFELLPLLDVAPSWHHPVRGEAAADLLAACSADQEIRPLLSGG
jgi:2-amino-4-hydroxy-6-hydroxymethyldihydropteridine diphosphokinase